MVQCVVHQQFYAEFKNRRVTKHFVYNVSSGLPFKTFRVAHVFVYLPHDTIR